MPPLLGRQITLFELLGFKVQIDLSWVFLALLVTWSLAKGYFPLVLQGLAEPTYWAMAVAGALGLFGSLIFHELSHSIVARRYGIPIKGITLFIFGGVAQMDQEPPSAKSEFLMAIAGPIASIALSLGFYLFGLVGEAYELPSTVLAVAGYLMLINGILAGFNLVPAFPLDGGRVFRAILWQWRGNLRSATRTASTFGSGFGIVLITLGLLNVVAGRLVLGIWWFLIGMFLRAAAKASYLQVLSRQIFEGEPIERFMTADPVSVSPSLSLRDFIDHYVYTYLHDMFPVVRDARLVGCIRTNQVSRIPRADWDRRTVGDVMTPCSRDNTITSDTDAVRALSIMKRTGNSRLLVTEGDHLIGIVVLKDLLKFFSLKLDLEGVD